MMNRKLFYIFFSVFIVVRSNAQNPAYSGGKGDGFAFSKLKLRELTSGIVQPNQQALVYLNNGVLTIENAHNIQSVVICSVLGSVLQEWSEISPANSLELQLNRDFVQQFVFVSYVSNGVMVSSKILVE